MLMGETEFKGKDRYSEEGADEHIESLRQDIKEFAELDAQVARYEATHPDLPQDDGNWWAFAGALSAPQAQAQGPSTLVVYGTPPQPELHDKTGKDLGHRFMFTDKNQDSFEKALRHALVDFTNH
jgi:hypothetical protein